MINTKITTTKASKAYVCKDLSVNPKNKKSGNSEYNSCLEIINNRHTPAVVRDAIDTILFFKKVNVNVKIHARKTIGSIKKITPAVVAAALPPLKLS